MSDGATLEQASADIERMLPIWIERFPLPGGTSGRRNHLDTWRMAPALRLKDDVIGGVRDVLWVVMAMIGIVLLIASNVANLLLVRSEGRAVELDVRAALGSAVVAHRALAACRERLARVARRLDRVRGRLRRVAGTSLAPPQLPRLDSIALDARSVGYATPAAVFSLAPMFRRSPRTVWRAARLARRERRTRAAPRRMRSS